MCLVSFWCILSVSLEIVGGLNKGLSGVSCEELWLSVPSRSTLSHLDLQLMGWTADVATGSASLHMPGFTNKTVFEFHVLLMPHEIVSPDISFNHLK